MAASFKYPHSVVNNYLAENLNRDGLLPKTVKVMRNRQEVTYGTIIGQEMVPEFSGASVITPNYIVFQIARDDTEHLEHVKYETILYKVYTQGKSAGLNIMNGITDALGRRDFTTDELMDYQLAMHEKESFHFLDIEYNVLGSAEAMNNGKEAGYYVGDILIQYSYTYEMDDRGRRIPL